ncbi:MAG: hypothetical protein ACN6O6_15420 [Pseudomonas sp.]|uniref:hypothetical protein n=1 Tax=Pseudomonas sp. TaxID=306 RepID=UPI003D1145A0
MPGENASLKEHLIPFVLRGKDELLPAAKKSEEALSSLMAEAQAIMGLRIP